MQTTTHSVSSSNGFAAGAPTLGMDVSVSGKHMAVGDALRSRITDELEQRVGKYFAEHRGGEGRGQADVFVGKEGHSICVDLVVRLPSGQRLESKGLGGDAHGAFDAALEKVEKRIRRYKRRLTNHHAGPSNKENVSLVVFSAPDDDADVGDEDYGVDGAESDKGGAAIIAESQAELKTMTVSMAVMELDLTEAPVVLFRNAAHGGLSVVYRRPDQNIGWIDPQRTAAPPASRSAV